MSTAVNGGSVSNGSFTSTKSNVADFDFLKTDNWMNFTSHSQTSMCVCVYIFYLQCLFIYFIIAGSPTKSAKTLSEPNYSGINIEPEVTKVPPKSGGDIFGDLLGSQGYTFSSKFNPGPKTINEMRREDLVKEIEPEKLKVYTIILIS